MGLLDFLIFADMDIRGKFETEKIKNKYSSITKNFRDNYFHYRHSKSQRPYSIAPIRTKPSRTYDPLTEVPGPEGDHVPMMLSKLDLGEKSDWTEIRNSLNKFGDNSGMFQDVSIKRKGRTGADPFQIGVKISGPPKNLIDVGYGVSQVLPVIFDLTRLSDHSLFLLQQPEVHLHPKAQASLGTFVVDQMLKHNQKFIIETHSDYIMDRVRSTVLENKQLKHSDVLILYFERNKSNVRIHEISMDEDANLLNVPDGYRNFFIDEERKLLGI